MPGKLKVSKVNDPVELAKAFAIRHEVFVIEQNCPPDLEIENDDKATHFLATFNGEPAGACRWRETDKGYKLERFAVLKQYRGKGIGQELMRVLLSNLPTDASYVYLHAQSHAVGLYEKLGFEKSGAEFEEAGMKHYKMVKS